MLTLNSRNGKVWMPTRPEVLGRPTRVRQTEDDRFFNIQAGPEEDTVMHVDASNPRFWLIYSTSRSTKWTR
jgi:hypothetical protein